MGRIAGTVVAPSNVLWTGYVFFVFSDAFASVPRRRDIPGHQSTEVMPSLKTENIADDRSNDLTYVNRGLPSVDKQTILSKIPSDLDRPIVEFIENNLPDLEGGNGDVLVVDDIIKTDNQYAPVSLLIGRTRINDVHRLNQFMQFCTERIAMGGYFVLRYMQLEKVIKSFKDRYPMPIYWAAYIHHFLWYRAIPKIQWLDRLYFTSLFSWLDTVHLKIVKKRNRALSKAEVWGRLSFWGMRVHAESKGDGELYIIAQRTTLPVENKIPSYYAIASLEKVGLEGKIIRTHKIRTMFPFSEFLQQRIFEDHGLAPTGKFANDFRLTDFGKFLRKYWLDELPQIFDWLRGDIKLVGMRATSRHFLSLYPKILFDLYIQIKPGLIPPVFDESITGFDQIVAVELTYLKSYWEQPIRTDVRYFFRTFTDIVFRGVRSK
jgi:lipopolysaccharide/colanic/teichoic acid biosynthesis glycosyltransferase